MIVDFARRFIMENGMESLISENFKGRPVIGCAKG